MAEAPPKLDESKLEAFMEKVIGDYSGAMTVTLCTLGDRLGLFKELAAGGPASAAEFASRAAVNQRYALEWLRGLTAAGYLSYDRATDRYELPAEHAPALAEEGGPFFFGGPYQLIPGAMAVLDELTERFRSGGGVDQAAYRPDWWEGMQRFTGSWFDNFLVQEWIPAMPNVERKLEAGAHCADIGCGSGRASIKLAGAYPKTTHVGYDLADAQIERAHANAAAAGLGDRVRFEKRDITKGLPEKYDLITTFDVIHDAIDPRGLLKAIREGLSEDGIYVCLDVNSADDPADNVGPIATMYYGFSIAYCMTTSLAHNGEGLGACGLPEAKLRELAGEAGFSEVRRVPIEDAFDILYEIRP